MENTTKTADDLRIWAADRANLVRIRSSPCVIAAYLADHPDQAIAEEVLTNREAMMKIVTEVRREKTLPDDAMKNAEAAKLPADFRPLFEAVWARHGEVIQERELIPLKPESISRWSVRRMANKFIAQNVGMICGLRQDACLFLSSTRTGIDAENLKKLDVQEIPDRTLRARLLALLSAVGPDSVSKTDILAAVGMHEAEYDQLSRKAVGGLRKISDNSSVQSAKNDGFRILTNKEVPQELLDIIGSALTAEETDILLHLIARTGADPHVRELLMAGGFASAESLELAIRKLDGVCTKIGISCQRNADDSYSVRALDQHNPPKWIREVQQTGDPQEIANTSLGRLLQAQQLTTHEFLDAINETLRPKRKRMQMHFLERILRDEIEIPRDLMGDLQGVLYSAAEKKRERIARRGEVSVYSSSDRRRHDEERFCDQKFLAKYNGAGLEDNQICALWNGRNQNGSKISIKEFESFLRGSTKLPIDTVVGIQHMLTEKSAERVTEEKTPKKKSRRRG